MRRGKPHGVSRSYPNGMERDTAQPADGERPAESAVPASPEARARQYRDQIRANAQSLLDQAHAQLAAAERHLQLAASSDTGLMAEWLAAYGFWCVLCNDVISGGRFCLTCVNPAPKPPRRLCADCTNIRPPVEG